MEETSQCKGLVCIRQRLVFHVSSSAHDFNEAASTLSNEHFDRLCDNVWYYCISRTPSTTLEWFGVDNDGDDGIENNDEEDARSPFASSESDAAAVFLASTNVSSVETMENMKLPKDERLFTTLAFDPQERSHIESCSFYVKDKIAKVALLIETETQTQRDEWVQYLRKVVAKAKKKKNEEKKEKEEKEEKEEKKGEKKVVEQEDDTQEEKKHVDTASVSSSFMSTRSLLHQGKSKELVEEGDPFGLLSLTTSALNSIKTMTSNAAPGMFTMDHLESIERSGQEEEMEDTDDSDTSATNTDLDGAADTAVDLSWMLAPKRQQSEQLVRRRERLNSNATDPFSSSVSRELASRTKSRRHSLSSMFHTSPDPTNGCLRCSKRFGHFIHTPKICASCSHRFCRDHCHHWTVLTTPESIALSSQEMKASQNDQRPAAATERKRVCMDCFVRQQLLTSVQEAGVYYASAVDEAGGVSRLVRWKYFDQSPKVEIEARIRARKLGPLSLLSAMFTYQQQPFMFVVVLAQLVHSVENRLDTMDFYWPQFLQWGFVNLCDASPSVRAFYLLFLAASARRSVHLAVKATWECIAAHWDAMSGGLHKRGNGIVMMLFFVTNVNFGESRSVLPQLLFPRAPKHQRESLEKLLEQLYEYVRRAYVASQRESPFFEWLLARSKEEIVASSRHVQRQLRVNDGFLDPFPTDYYDEAQLLLFERRRSGTQHFVETKQRMWNKPTQHIFSDEVRLVRFLVDLCTYLKENIPEPSQRKKELPQLLQEMLHGKHIRPEAALPLTGAATGSHRVVNVLTNEGTVFSTKARAPTLVFFEIISSALGRNDESHDVRSANHDSNLAALVDAAMDMNNDMDGVLEPYEQEIGNYISPSHSSLKYPVSEDIDNLDYVSSTDCTPLSEKTDGDGFSGNESGESAAHEKSEEGDTPTSESASSSTTSSEASKCPFFGERFAEMQRRIRECSSFSRYEGWALVPVIAKSFDDMRQEVFVLQGLKLFQLIFRKHGLDLWMRYYSIVCAGKDCGLLEVITDAQSLDGLKKKGRKISGVGTSLPKIFERACGRDPVTGEHDPVRLERARANFITSMAAYSLFSYIFLVKDRHNGNIMLDTEGHVVHIDFGFVLGIAPGNTFSLETAPFKLTPEMVETMGAEGFDRYRRLVAQGLLALHLEATQLVSLVYLSAKDSCFPCFKGQSRARIIRRLSHRLCVGWSVQYIERAATRLVDKSNGHRGTRQYDWFQKISNGILP